MIWMKITLDRYELPVAVAGSARELARIAGTTVGTIYTERYLYRIGKRKSCRWICVEE